MGPGRCVCRWAAARPRAVRAASFARRVVSKPGQAPPPPTGTATRPSGPSGYLHTGGTWCAGMWPGQAPPPPTAPPPVIQNAQLASESPVIRGYVERYTLSTHISVTPTGTAARTSDRGRPRGVLYMGVPRGALVARDVGEGCRADVTVYKKSAAPAGLRTCVELRRCRNSLNGGRPSPGAWRRRAR